jgi:hypothetical protein
MMALLFNLVFMNVGQPRFFSPSIPCIRNITVFVKTSLPMSAYMLTPFALCLYSDHWTFVCFPIQWPNTTFSFSSCIRNNTKVVMDYGLEKERAFFYNYRLEQMQGLDLSFGMPMRAEVEVTGAA